jgi:suppressor for copper-sensitivity B
MIGSYMKFHLPKFVKKAGILAASALIAVGLFASPSIADEDASPWIKTDQTSVRLIAARSSIGDNQDVQLGLQFKMKKGWKIYWRSPGDAGFPPSLNWQKSENLEKTDFGWPLPSRFQVSGLQTLGYKKEVVFPITAKVKDPTQPLKLRANLNYLVCDDICIPYKTDVSFDLPAGTTVDRMSENYHLITQYAAKIPGDGTAHNLSIESVETTGSFTEVEKDVRKGFIRIKAKSGIPFTKPDVFIEGPELTYYGAPLVSLSHDGSTATIKVSVTEEENAKLVTASLRLTLKDGARSAERTLTVTPGISAPTLTKTLPFSLPLILGFALLGGLILNLMPCVLPVISLKILGVVSHGGADDKTVRTSFIASSLGIIFSFLVIGGGLIGLKLAGSAVGWGIQFQHPWFIIGLSIIVTLFAYNLWGLFELRLPSWISDRASASTGQAEDHQSFSGNFATGAFATVLATPCSAPFLGTAVGFALAGGTVDILAVFFALGVGMALPFLTIAAFPRLASRMPKPGLWMVKVKKVLGAALAATAIWLLSVLAFQLSTTAALVVAGLMVILGLLLVARNRLPETRKRFASLGIVVIVLAAFWTPSNFTPSAVKIDGSKEAYWQPFAPEKIPALVAAGQTVFVDVTAEWCITCQVNKATVLRRGEIKELLTSGKIIAMQGDWTRPDAKIAAYLKSFGRFGIPFNAVYGPGSPNGEPLAELLTTDAVLEGLKKASNGSLLAIK